MTLIQCRPQTREQRPPTAFHKIRLLDINNADVDFYALRGKTVLVDVFSSHCMPCLYLMPRWEAWTKTYKDKSFTVVGIALDRQKELLRPFLSMLKVSYSVALADESLFEGKTILGPVLTVPRQYIIDGCGQIRHIFQGMNKPETIEAALKGLLNAPPACPPQANEK
jgi:thiol-disulfide isomerase/thioredoxin